LKKFLFALALVAVPALASAQATNPASVVFDSADHAQVVRYSVGYFIGAAAAPAQEFSVPVAGVSGSAAAGRSLVLARPVFGNFTLKLRAIGSDGNGGEVSSPWSPASLPFVFSPLAPAIRGLQ
jgi:hypothetical protein